MKKGPFLQKVPPQSFHCKKNLKISVKITTFFHNWNFEILRKNKSVTVKNCNLVLIERRIELPFYCYM